MQRLNSLLRLNLEIDGALRTYAARHDRDSFALLSEKIADFNTIFQTLNKKDEPESISFPSPQISYNKETVIETTDETNKPVSNSQPSENKIVSIILPHEEELEDKTEENDEVSTKEVSVDEESDTKMTIEEVEDEPAAPETYTVNINESDQVILDEESLIDSKIRPIEEEILEKITVPYEKKEEKNETTIDEVKTKISPITSDKLRVEEVISRREAQDLSKAFTLNDKFRFLRGLFCDDKADFDDTLKHLSELDSLDEAYDYLLNELEWDVDNEEVQAFISIIANHFNEA